MFLKGDSHIKQTSKQNISGITPCETNGVILMVLYFGKMYIQLILQIQWVFLHLQKKNLYTECGNSTQKICCKDKKLNSSLFGILRRVCPR